jgi:lysine-N-methylase
MESYADTGWLGKRYDVLGQVVRKWSDTAHSALDSGSVSAYALYDEVVAHGELRYRLLPEYAAVVYQELNHCKPQWSPRLQQMEQVLHEMCDSETYYRHYEDFTAYMNQREYEYEHLLSYYVFRYFCKAYFDDDVYGKAQLAVMGYLLLKELGVCQWVQQNGVFTKGDQSELFHLYSRELEHSDENYDTFVDLLKMENMCNYEHLLAILLER